MSLPPAGPPMSYPGAPAQPSPDRESVQTSAILLIVVGFLCAGTLPAIFGIIALVTMDTDLHSARRMNKIGWISFWVILGLIILFVIAYFVIGGLILGVLAVMMPALVGV